MINHARTLLLNRDADDSPGYEFPGEHPVAPGYKALQLPSFLRVIRSRLFGADPDRAMLNYRVHQLLGLIHATELHEHVTHLDSRITYLTSDRKDLFEDTAFTPVVYPLSGNAAVNLQGEPSAPDAHGRLRHQYIVQITGPTTAKVSELAPHAHFQNCSFTYTDGLTSTIPLAGSGYGVLLETDAVGSRWLIEFCNRPQWDLGQLAVALKSVGEPTLLQLFGTQRVEPYSTFRNLWETRQDLAYSLGGLVLALIYRTEELRVNG